MNSFILTADGVAGLAQGRPFTVTRDHANYADIIQAVKDKHYELIHDLVDVGAALKKYAVTSKIAIDSEQGIVYFQSKPVHGVIVNRIIDMMHDGFDIMPMVLFLENLMDNPSPSAIEELYGFLEHSKMPITEDGHFIAWKRVADDLTSFYDFTTPHVFGQVVSMPRSDCNSNRDQTCSTGLHFCAQSYLPEYHGGKGRVLIVKINPRDVVSIPSDYNNAKGRACQYVPIGELVDQARERIETENILNQPVVFTGTFSAAVDHGAMNANLVDLTGKPATYKDGFASGIAAAKIGDQSLFKIFKSRPMIARSISGSSDFDYYSTRTMPLNDFGQGYVDGFAAHLAVRSLNQQPAVNQQLVNTDLHVWGSVVTNVNASVEFVRGYKQGYADGKKKESVLHTGDLDDYTTGYNAGAKDGRGHKPKLYK